MSMKYDWSCVTPRERDALVAEHVMGWDVPYEIPSYTTDIAAAYTVFTRFGYQGTLGYQGTYVFCSIDNGVGINAMRGEANSGCDHVTSLAEVIALSALRAVGVDV